MKKLGLLFKETSEKTIKDRLKDSNAVFIVKYSGVSSPDLSSLRKSLKTSNAAFFVVKNSIARRAFKDSEIEPMIKSVDGPCGVIFIKDEPVIPSKIIADFRKTNEKLVLEGGFLKEKKILNAGDIEKIAKLPSMEVLRAQLVMTLNSPVSKLVFVLNNTLSRIVYCLNQIKDKKSG